MHGCVGAILTNWIRGRERAHGQELRERGFKCLRAYIRIDMFFDRGCVLREDFNGCELFLFFMAGVVYVVSA